MLAINEIKVPDIGDFKDVPVIEIHVQPGAKVERGRPSGLARVRQGDHGRARHRGRHGRGGSDQDRRPGERGACRSCDCGPKRPPAMRRSRPRLGHRAAGAGAAAAADRTADRLSQARPRPPGSVGRFRRRCMRAPSVRRLARELDVDLAKLKGTGEKGRITKDDVKAFLRGPAATPGAAPAAAGGMGIPEIPAVDFSKFGPDRDQAAAAHQAPVGPASAPLLAQRPARHAWRRGGHHRDRGLPQGTRRRGQGEGLPRHAAGLPDEGQRLLPARLPGVQRLAQPGEGRADPQALLQYRRRGRHAGRAGRAGGQGRRPQGHRRAQPGARRIVQEGARRQALRRPTCRAAPSPSPASAASAAPPSRPIVNAPEVAILGVVRSKMAPVWDGKAGASSRG